MLFRYTPCTPGRLEHCSYSAARNYLVLERALHSTVILAAESYIYKYAQRLQEQLSREPTSHSRVV